MNNCTVQLFFFFFFFNDTPTTEIYTLSLHDALPISAERQRPVPARAAVRARQSLTHSGRDRKSTRLNSSHVKISYAVFCLKKKKQKNRQLKHNKLQCRYDICILIKIA